MEYKVEIDSKARLEFQKLPKDTAKDLLLVFEDLKQQPEPPGAKKLSANNDYRIRRGLYRVLYTVDRGKGLVRVYNVSRRRYIYNRIGEQLYRIRTGAPPEAAAPPPPKGAA